jgi:hypothetical protein
MAAASSGFAGTAAMIHGRAPRNTRKARTGIGVRHAIRTISRILFSFLYSKKNNLYSKKNKVEKKSGYAVFRSEEPRGTTTTPPSRAPRAAPRSHRGSLSPPSHLALLIDPARPPLPPTRPRALPNPNCRCRPPASRRRRRPYSVDHAAAANLPRRRHITRSAIFGVIPPRALPIGAGSEFR